MYKITKREITFDDYLKLKKFNPFKKFRTDAKTVNFGTIFACTGPTLGRQMKMAGFVETDCDLAMETFGLIDAYNKACIQDPSKDPLELKYMIVGTKLRELFFQTYPGLLKRVEREQRFAVKNGYVRTWTGPVRHFPELRYFHYNANGSITGVDKKLFSKMFSHLKNNACNTTIQTAEVYQAMPDVTCVATNLKEWGFKSYIFNYVHDSLELYIHKSEKDIVYALLNKVAQINRQPYYNLPMHIDVEECDLNNKEEYFKHGREINIENYDLDKLLDEYNKQHNTELKFINNIPIYGKVV